MEVETIPYLSEIIVGGFVLYVSKSHYDWVNSLEYHTFQGIDMKGYPSDLSNPEQIKWVMDQARDKLGQIYPMRRCMMVIGAYEERFPNGI